MQNWSLYYWVLETISKVEAKILQLSNSVTVIAGERLSCLMQNTTQSVMAGETTLSTFQAVDMLHALAWEKLHIGHWKDVSIVWRDVYAFTSLILVSLLPLKVPKVTMPVTRSQNMLGVPSSRTPKSELEPPNQHSGEHFRGEFPADTEIDQGQHQHQQQPFEELRQLLEQALRVLDLSIMMGGPLFLPILHEATEIVQTALQEVLRQGGTEGSACGIRNGGYPSVPSITCISNGNNMPPSSAACIIGISNGSNLPLPSIACLSNGSKLPSSLVALPLEHSDAGISGNQNAILGVLADLKSEETIGKESLMTVECSREGDAVSCTTGTSEPTQLSAVAGCSSKKRSGMKLSLPPPKHVASTLRAGAASSAEMFRMPEHIQSKCIEDSTGSMKDANLEHVAHQGMPHRLTLTGYSLPMNRHVFPMSLSRSEISSLNVAQCSNMEIGEASPSVSVRCDDEHRRLPDDPSQFLIVQCVAECSEMEIGMGSAVPALQGDGKHRLLSAYALQSVEVKRGGDLKDREIGVDSTLTDLRSDVNFGRLPNHALRSAQAEHATDHTGKEVSRGSTVATLQGSENHRHLSDPALQFVEAEREGDRAHQEIARGYTMATLQGTDDHKRLSDNAIQSVEVDYGSEYISEEMGIGSTVAALRSPCGRIPLPEHSLHSELATRPAVAHSPSLETFFVEYMTPGRPVIISGAISHWPALQRWRKPGYLARVAGHRTVPVEVGRHYLDAEWGTSLMTLNQFLEQYMAQGAKLSSSSTAKAKRTGYLAQHPLFEQVPALAADICMPEYVALGSGNLQAINAWLGPAGTITPLHTDPPHNLLAQVVGSKYVRLYAPECTSQLHPFTEGLTTNASQVDLDQPDPGRFPEVTSLPFQDCILQEGQMLYIPPGWWHYVKSLSTSFSVSFWWQ